MTVVVPRIPLIMFGSIRPKPRSYGLLCCIRQCIAQVSAIARRCVELRRTQLHVIGPVVFFIEVRRSTGRALAHAGGSLADGVGGQRFLAELGGEWRISPAVQ